MKKSILLIFVLIACAISVEAVDITNEQLTYNVMFKWGLINKKAGTVTIDTSAGEDNTFNSVLIGKSASWADKFYTVRDTLLGTIQTQGLVPLSYQKISHEGGEFKRDIITYSRNGNEVNAQCDRYHQKKPVKPIVHSQKLLSANGYTLDMLTAFYYMRFLDYPLMVPGESSTMNIFSGKKKETLKITYNGIQQIDHDNRACDCYYITFSFTSDDGKKSSDNLEAWISTADNRIPLKLQGKLPVGMVKCYYIP